MRYYAAEWISKVDPATNQVYGASTKAIQAAYDYAVVDQSRGGQRGGTLVIDRVPNIREWLGTVPLVFGPGHHMNVEGDGATGRARWGGTRIDFSGIAGPALRLIGGEGIELSNFTIIGGGIGIWCDADASKGIQSYDCLMRRVSVITDWPGGIALKVEGSGPRANWGGVSLNNDQVWASSRFDTCHFESTTGTGVRWASKQAVSSCFDGGTIGGHIGLELVAGHVVTRGVNFASITTQTEPCDHVVQHGQPQHFSVYSEYDGYHELRGWSGDRGFVGRGTNGRPTIIRGSRYSMQRGPGVWVDAPNMHLLRLDGCAFEEDDRSKGSTRVLHRFAEEYAARESFKVETWKPLAVPA